jgi:hypothetical protein
MPEVIQITSAPQEGNGNKPLLPPDTPGAQTSDLDVARRTNMPNNNAALNGIPAVYHWAILSGYAQSAGSAVVVKRAPQKQPFNEAALISVLGDFVNRTVTKSDVDLLIARYEKPAEPIQISGHALRLLEFVSLGLPQQRGRRPGVARFRIAKRTDSLMGFNPLRRSGPCIGNSSPTRSPMRSAA